MRTSTLIAGLCAFAASNVAAQYFNQSDPFYLVVLSPSNSTINGSTLAACHEGAAIEGLCLAGKLPPTAYYSTFTFNTSTSPGTTVPASGAPGYLAYELVGENFQVSEPMQLLFNPTSNVAVPLFEPTSGGTVVAFDGYGLLNIQGYMNDTTSPPTIALTAYYNWYICITDVGYMYTTLAWAVGIAPPQNPTCVKVDVLRVFM